MSDDKGVLLYPSIISVSASGSLAFSFSLARVGYHGENDDQDDDHDSDDDDQDEILLEPVGKVRPKDLCFIELDILGSDRLGGTDGHIVIRDGDLADRLTSGYGSVDTVLTIDLHLDQRLIVVYEPMSSF